MMGLNWPLLEAPDLAGSKSPAPCNANTFLMLSGLTVMNFCFESIRKGVDSYGGSK